MDYKNPIFPEYAIESARLKSFDEWPPALTQKPKQFTEAGFFYTQKGDRVMCYSCGNGLRFWEPMDDPFEQHAFWYEDCCHINLIKGREYVKQIKRKFTLKVINTKTQNEQKQINELAELQLDEIKLKNEKSTQTEESNDQRKICTICCNNQLNVVLIPCGHALSCVQCTTSLTECPMCRKSFDKIVKIYYA